MASLTITVDDTLIPRIRAAYGVSTNPELKAAIIADIKNRTVNYEVKLTEDAEVAKVVAAQQAKDTAIASKIEASQAEIVLT